MIRPSQGDARVAVLLPAAGAGTRMGGARKQLRLLGGRTVLEQTLAAFDRHPRVATIVVAAPADVASEMGRALTTDFDKVASVVPGGPTRQDSVRAALQAADPDVDVVLVHDAVRPFVSEALITAVIDAAVLHGAAAPAVPVTDTLRRTDDDGRYADTVVRDHLVRMQTPQGFRRAWLHEAFALAHREGHRATDDVALVQHLGRPVAMVEGSTINVKITTAADWMLAQALWPDWCRGQMHPVAGTSGPS